jgi:hypothetical protein
VPILAKNVIRVSSFSDTPAIQDSVWERLLMMGTEGSDQNRLFYSFNLDEHVPADHLLRGIDRFLDLSELRRHLIRAGTLAYLAPSSRASSRMASKQRARFARICRASTRKRVVAWRHPGAASRRRFRRQSGPVRRVARRSRVLNQPSGRWNRKARTQEFEE